MMEKNIATYRACKLVKKDKLYYVKSATEHWTFGIIVRAGKSGWLATQVGLTGTQTKHRSLSAAVLHLAEER